MWQTEIDFYIYVGFRERWKLGYFFFLDAV